MRAARAGRLRHAWHEPREAGTRCVRRRRAAARVSCLLLSVLEMTFEVVSSTGVAPVDFDDLVQPARMHRHAQVGRARGLDDDLA